jgi:hypothetical protein
MSNHLNTTAKKPQNLDSTFKVNPSQTRGFGVQAKSEESAPVTKAQLWKNYQQAKQLNQNGANIAPILVIQAKMSMLQRSGLSANGQPGDKYEQEADSVAERVMAMSEPAQVQREELEEEEELTEPLAGTISPLLQRDESSEKEDEEDLQIKAASASNPPVATTSLEDRLSSSKGGGSPLSDDVRSFMEPRFGADFSGVRVHTGSDAVQMNQDVNAQAFAHGSDVYFGAGKAPGKDALTAHELTHVVQQTGVMEFQRKEENIIQQFPWEKIASETACALLSDEEIYGLFVNFYFSSQPNARKHLEHYVKGGGKDYAENVPDLFGANPRIRSRIAQLINEQIANGSTTSGSIVGKGVDDGQDAPIAQSDYDSEDWRNANGNIDQVDWQLIGTYNPAGYNKFQITITDPYTWHPLEKRPTQCLHEAFERLKSQSAADYITKGTAAIVLPPVSQSPDVPIESDN